MARQNIDRRLAAILSADVVGYSRLMGIDETGTLGALRAHRAELIDSTIAEHNGRIVKLMGDGLLVEFASAIAIQHGMAARNAKVPDDRLIAFRIGTNSSERTGARQQRSIKCFRISPSQRRNLPHCSECIGRPRVPLI